MVQQPPGPPPGGMQPPPPPPGQPPQAPMGPPPRAQLDTSKLPIPDIVVLAGSLLAWIMALISWYKAKGIEEFFGVKLTYKGNYQWLPWFIFFFLFLFAAFVVANKFGNFVDLNIPTGLIYVGAAAAGEFFVLLAILIRPGGWDVSTMNWVVWIIAIILSAVPIVGGVMAVQQG